MRLSLNDIPDELVRHILLHLSPETTLLSFQLVSRRYRHLSNEPLLWRFHCLHFRYWNEEHNLSEKVMSRASSVDWKGLWILRKKKNLKAARLLNSILSSSAHQLSRLRDICVMGYDVKDFLLAQIHCPDSAEDVLARRYYATTALDCIHRAAAIDIWASYQGRGLSSDGLDRALAAYDLFVLHDQEQDVDYVVRTLDDIADQFRLEHPNFYFLSTRQKALALARWLRAHNLTGMDNPQENYRNLRNCFIGHALSDPDHPSLPIISSAIFTCVAQRLGLKAFCLAFPNHVHAAVYAPAGQDLDGNYTRDTNPEKTRMYLDPYSHDGEVPLGDLRRRLADYGWTQLADAFLQPSPVPVIVNRTGQNIRATFDTVHNLASSDHQAREMKRLRGRFPGIDLDAAVYASMWAELLVTQATHAHWGTILATFLQKFAVTWAEDLWLVEKYLLPLYERFVNATADNPIAHRPEPGSWANIYQILDLCRKVDHVPDITRRTPAVSSRVHYKIGQVFQHRRYRYVGVINGWAVTGQSLLPEPYHLDAAEAEEEGDAYDPTESVHEANLGPSRTYYTCIHPRKATIARMRVSQENVVIVKDPRMISPELLFLAGRFFKRFDPVTCTFVSNIREYYPDD